MDKEDEKLLNRKRFEKWVKILLLFLAFMWLCTIISKSIYVNNLARVNVQTAEKKYIEHIVEADGIVIAGSEQAVNTMTGLRISHINVQEGDFVESGTVLFQIDLEDLNTILSEKETELAKQQYHLSDLQFNAVLTSQKQTIAMLWAQEDYDNADKETSRIVSRAQQDLKNAEDELNKHLKTTVPYVSDNKRSEAWDSYNNWKKRHYEITDNITAKQREINELAERINQLEQNGGTTTKEADLSNNTKEIDEMNNNKTNSSITLSENSTKEDTDHPEASETQSTESIQTEQDIDDNESTSEPDTTLESDTKTPKTTEYVLSGSESPRTSSEVAALEEALKKAKSELATLEDTLAAHERNSISQPDFSKEESDYDNWQQKKSTLEDAVVVARRALEDAEYTRVVTLMQKSRELASAAVNNPSDSTMSIYELEIANLQAELAQFYALKNQNGEIKAQKDGYISKIQIQVGSRTTDTAAIILTDAKAPCQFKCSITKEQSKYLKLGDSFQLTIHDNGKKELEATVDYLTENAAGGYDIICRLPEGIGQPGTNGTIHKAVQGELYNTTFPIEALHEENESYYVYIYREKAGILGNEAYVEKLKIQVADQNDRYVALQSGTIGLDAQVITFSSEELKQGQSVRLVE